jgi:hypothetical protein
MTSKPSNSTWSALLASGLHASADETAAGMLNADVLVRLVDRRWRNLQKEGLQRLGIQAEELAAAAADRRKQSLASVAVLAQRWQLQGAPGLGAFTLRPGEEGKARLAAPDLELLKEAAGAQLRRMRRSASDSKLGRTLARTMSGRDLAGLAARGAVAPAEWDLFKSLDNNLRSLERTFRESTAKQRKAAVRRRKALLNDEVRGSACAAEKRANTRSPRAVALGVVAAARRAAAPRGLRRCRRSLALGAASERRAPRPAPRRMRRRCRWCPASARVRSLSRCRTCRRR